MDDPPCPVLAAVVAIYDETHGTVTESLLRERLDWDRGRIRERLARLLDFEFIAESDGGHRPTVTGRDFLALDVDCGPLIVDLDAE